MLVQNIKNYAKAQGKSIADVEREAGLVERTIYRWDEYLPSYDKVVRVAKVLGVTVEALTA